LDVDTLELLEDLLADYSGTLLLVSHDRTFLDNVVTSTLVFEGAGKVGEYAGGYEDWERQRPFIGAERASTQKTFAPAPPADKGNKARKLTYKERRELEALPGTIEALEAEQAELHAVMGDADFYRQPGEKIAAALQRLEEIKTELEACYARWQWLESQANASG
jgi:ABC transport system ATP-binding/permease protein